MTDGLKPAAADLVCNRACVNLGEGIGDRLLGALLLVHGMVMNGGPNHAADSCEPAEITAAAEACHHFGLNGLATVIQQLPAAASDTDDAEKRLDTAYHALVPSDSTLYAAFAARYAEAPEDFDPI